MDGYPGKTDPATWRAHADAGRTTWTAGQPGGRQAGFLYETSAVHYAADNGLPLFRWEGRTGHQIEIPEMEAE